MSPPPDTERDDSSLPATMLDAAVELLGRSGRGGTVRLRGESMLPLLRAGQLVAVEFAPGPVDPGDLLLFRQHDYLVVHRMVGRARSADGRPILRTRGDAIPELDPPLFPERVVGRVVGFEDAAGQWRSTVARRARLYARAAALHDLVWAGVVALARRVDRLARRAGLRTPFGRWATWFDRSLMRLTHRVLGRLLHPRTAASDTA